ncbi:hypothetical protein AVEN_175783-1 [Araneus ventricosus]|uniref:Uncharacterized protein n=1 Tax=Araneus ventricosus TaxID=182803 RepID=A0A4Y2JJA9_ARAVE|nr:hypothetical protein AVEN_112344-1 [Araneus ventricosus]GBM89362.1 hypothetical protein AVEN_175783-1 [Araneus ventricosus]
MFLQLCEPIIENRNLLFPVLVIVYNFLSFLLGLFDLRGPGDLVVRSRLRGRRAPGSKPYSTEDRPCMRACCTLNRGPNFLPLVWCGSLECVLAQVSFSSSACGSKMTRSVPNSPRVAPKAGR